VILGASGGVGRELVLELLKSPKWSEVAVIVRRVVDEWKNLPAEQEKKLKIIKVEDLEALGDTKKWKFDNYNSMFSCLGSVSSVQRDIFRKVEITYPSYGGQIAKENGIPYHAIVTADGASKSSWIWQLNVKAEVEEKLISLAFPYLGIFRAGVLTNRKEERLIEKIMRWAPFLSSIDARDVALAMKWDAEQYHEGKSSNKISPVIYSNKEMLRIAKPLKMDKA